MSKREKEKVQFLVKFGKKEFMENLLKKGEIYTNPVQDFRKIEDKFSDLRRDKYEGATKIYRKDIRLTIRDPETNQLITTIDTDSGLSEFVEYKDQNINIACMTAITTTEGERYFNQGGFIPLDLFRRFGLYCVIIINPKEFINRLTKAIEENSSFNKYGYKLVNYIDIDKIHGEYSIFNKPLEYEYQREIRFLFEPSSFERKPLFLRLGDLRDIAIIEHVDDLYTTLNVTPRNMGVSFNLFTPYKLQVPKSRIDNIDLVEYPLYKSNYDKQVKKYKLDHRPGFL